MGSMTRWGQHSLYISQPMAAETGRTYHCKELEGKLRTQAVPLSSEIQHLLTLCQKADRETAPHIINLDQGNLASKADAHSSLQVCENETCIYYAPRSVLWICVHAHSVVSDSLWPCGCNPPGFSVHGIFQASIWEWVAISYSGGILPGHQGRPLREGLTELSPDCL